MSYKVKDGAQSVKFEFVWNCSTCVQVQTSQNLHKRWEMKIGSSDSGCIIEKPVVESYFMSSHSL